MLGEEQFKEGKKEKLGPKKKGQEMITHEESNGSNKKSSKEKYEDKSAKVPELEEDPNIPEPHSEKQYKVRSSVIAPC